MWEKFLISGDIGKSFLKLESTRNFVINPKCPRKKYQGKISLLVNCFPTGQMPPCQVMFLYQANVFLSGKLFPAYASLSGKLYSTRETFSYQKKSLPCQVISSLPVNLFPVSEMLYQQKKSYLSGKGFPICE